MPLWEKYAVSFYSRQDSWITAAGFFFFQMYFNWNLNTEVFSSRIHIPEKAEKSTPRTRPTHNKTVHGKGKICSFILE